MFTGHYLLLLSPLAILVAGWFAWREQSRIAARTATFKFVAEIEVHNSEWQKAVSEFYKSLNSAEKENSSTYFRNKVLNHCELIAIAIKNKSMDEELYKQWNANSYVHHWKSAASCVHARRQEMHQPNLYREFELLATRWDRPEITTT